MVIGIDGNEANLKNRVGVGQYAYYVLKNLNKLDKENEYIIFLKEKPLKDLPKSNPNWKYKVFGPKKLWSRLALPIHLLLQNNKLDLFFSLSHYSPKHITCPTVPTIHDLGYLKFKNQFTKKDLYQLIHWTKQAIKSATHIVTVSEFSKNEIQKIYKINPNKISIAYNGVSTPPRIKKTTQQEILNSYNLEAQKYFLYLGTLKPNKNIPFLIKSFALYLQKESLNRSIKNPTKLVIAGKKGWLFQEIFKTVKKKNIQNHVIFTDYVSEEQKWTLYKNAIASILPSVYEGFGIPVIESMKVNTPVIASNIPPLKEVIKDAGLFIDPTDEKDLCFKMAKMLNPQIRQKYARLGKKEADSFTWENTAKSIIKVFQNIKK